MENVEAGDERLWRRSLEGDSEAFGLIYDRHRDGVFRHAYRLTGDRADSEDILATAFLELWRCRERVRLVEGSVLPWLLVTTTNISRNLIRAAFRYRKLLSTLTRERATSDPADEFSQLQKSMDHDFAAALKLLKPIDLQLLTLVIFEDYSIAAASSIVGLTPQAAKSRLHRARERMRTALEGHTRTASSLITEGNRS